MFQPQKPDSPWPCRASVVAALALVSGCGRSTGADLAPIRLDSMLVIGAVSGDGAMATWPRVSARHPLGYRILVPQPGSVPALPLVYDDSGGFVATLGTRGESPQDFVEPLFARIGPGDSVWVFDGALRALVFTPERRYARTIRLPAAPWDAVVMSGGRIAITPAVYGAPLPWYLLDAEGNELARVGTNDTTIPSPRRIVAGQDGTVWTIAMTHRWRVEEWDLAGNLLRSLAVAPDWFEAHDFLLPPTADRPPQPAVQDAWVDIDGRVWLVGKVADAAWREGLGESANGEASIRDSDRVYDTVVEVRDPTTGAVLGSARFDAAYPFIAEPGVLMRVQSTAGGWQRAELARVLVDTARLAGGRP